MTNNLTVFRNLYRNLDPKSLTYLEHAIDLHKVDTNSFLHPRNQTRKNYQKITVKLTGFKDNIQANDIEVTGYHSKTYYKFGTQLLPYTLKPRKRKNINQPSILKTRFRNGFTRSFHLLFHYLGEQTRRNILMNVRPTYSLNTTIARRAIALNKRWFFSQILSSYFNISLKSPLYVTKKRFKKYRPQMIYLGFKFRLRIKQRHNLKAFMQKSLLRALGHKSIRRRRGSRKKKIRRRSNWHFKNTLKLKPILRKRINVWEKFRLPWAIRNSKRLRKISKRRRIKLANSTTLGKGKVFSFRRGKGGHWKKKPIKITLARRTKKLKFSFRNQLKRHNIAKIFLKHLITDLPKIKRYTLRKLPYYFKFWRKKSTLLPVWLPWARQIWKIKRRPIRPMWRIIKKGKALTRFHKHLRPERDFITRAFGSNKKKRTRKVKEIHGVLDGRRETTVGLPDYQNPTEELSLHLKPQKKALVFLKNKRRTRFLKYSRRIKHKSYIRLKKVLKRKKKAHYHDKLQIFTSLLRL